jgi:hypothetical protein
MDGCLHDVLHLRRGRPEISEEDGLPPRAYPIGSVFECLYLWQLLALSHYVDEHGGSQIDFTVHRVGKNLKGRVLATLLRVFGRRIFRQDLDQTLKRLAEESPATALL